MKKLLFILLCLPLFLFGQNEKAPTLYEVVNIKVNAGQEDDFEAAVKDHNKKFHNEGLYNARVAYNINGPMGGTYSWIMGPTSYTAMDNRPGKGAHDNDWKTVDKYVEKYSSPSYWSLDTKLTQYVENKTNVKRLIWMYDIKKGERSRWSDLVGKIKEVYEKKRADETFIVVWNEFANTKAGQDAAIIFSFDKWSWLDRKSNFSKDYEDVHGMGSWHNFLNEFSSIVDGRVDWMRYFIE